LDRIGLFFIVYFNFLFR